MADGEGDAGRRGVCAPPSAGSRRSSTNSAPNCRSRAAAEAGRMPQGIAPGACGRRCALRAGNVVRRWRDAARRDGLAAMRSLGADVHHADGGGRRLGGGGACLWRAAWLDRGAGARPRLCQQWRRHRLSTWPPARTVRIGLVDRPDRPSLFGTRPRCSRTTARRHRHQRLARPQLLARHRRRGDRAGAQPPPTADAAATLIANAVDLPGHPAVAARAGHGPAAGQRPRRSAW